MKLISGSSNWVFIFPGQCFVKIYKRLRKGPNPEVEMGNFLHKKKFTYIAKILGSLKCGEYTIAIMQQALRPGPNAWDLLGKKPSAKKAALLGKRLAQMHIALGKGREAAFVPEPFTTLYKRRQNQSCQKLAKQVQEHLPDVASLLQKIRRLRASDDTGMRIRIHGDLHLGQIQWNPPDFFFVDFEGEPERSLDFRREKHSPLRDVAGMLRSFAYADAKFGGKRPDLATPFLEAYWQEMGDSRLLPRSAENRKALLESYVLEKALYEVGYEAANRPDWLWVPLGFLYSLHD